MIRKDRRLSVKIKKKFGLIVPSIQFLLSLLKSYYKVQHDHHEQSITTCVKKIFSMVLYTIDIFKKDKKKKGE